MKTRGALSTSLFLLQAFPLASPFLARPTTWTVVVRTGAAPSCISSRRHVYSLRQQPRWGRRDLAACAKPKRGNVVDSYQTVSVNCSKCGTRLFRTKSNLVKCFVERIADDCAGVLRDQGLDASTYECPSCQTKFARAAVIRGLPALKLVGGKTRMTKK